MRTEPARATRPCTLWSTRAARNTVRRFARAATWQELATGKWQCLPTILDAVEGQVNRIKMLKRQMFGRAGLDPLRKRVLLAA
ncbi:hypothetical protein ACWCQK_41015 [Streptomyces sp. NPDC002306]